MSKSRRKPAYWRGGAPQAAAAGESCRAGDGIAPRGDEQEWRGLRHQLAHRGLTVVSAGRRLSVVAQETVPRLDLLRSLAAAAGQDGTALAALHDLIEEVVGAAPGQAKGLARAFAEACAGADRGHRQVPGGKLTGDPGARKPPPPAPVRLTAVRSLERRAARLSRLQRSILSFALNYSADHHGAPLELLRPKTRPGAAALSRALRRLEARRLIDVRRTDGGRATHVRLTPDGRGVLGVRWDGRDVPDC
jgi:hypothetical protein